jgi:hypothetical protein
MIPNSFLSEKLAQAHHEDLLREAEQQRLVAQLPEPGRSQHTLPARLLSFLQARSFGTLSVRHYQGAHARET